MHVHSSMQVHELTFEFNSMLSESQFTHLTSNTVQFLNCSISKTEEETSSLNQEQGSRKELCMADPMRALLLSIFMVTCIFETEKSVCNIVQYVGSPYQIWYRLAHTYIRPLVGRQT